MDLILYSTDCPRCKVIKKKLETKNLEYKENMDVDEMQAMGIQQVPVLSVDGRLMEFAEACRWVNEI